MAAKRKGQKKMQAAQAPIVEVDNPAEYAERVVHPKVKVERALRDDPLGQMHERGQVKEHQYRAGREFQAAAERVSVGHVRSMDFSNEPVDGSRRASLSVVNPGYLRAVDLRAKWINEIGRPGFRLLEAVLIDKVTIREAARQIYDNTSKAGLTFTGHRFRECLDGVARTLGLVG